MVFTNFKFEGHRITLGIWDSDLQKDTSKKLFNNFIQPLKGDIVMLCFSLVSPNSLRGILDFHYPEIKKIRPDLRFVLVGLKSDLRDECNESSYNENAYHSRQIIPSSQIEEVKNIIGAEAYVECSAKNNEHVVDVIEAGFRALIAKRNENTLTLRESEQNKCQLR